MFHYYGETFLKTPTKDTKGRVKKYYYCDLCEDGAPSKAWDMEADVEIHRRTDHSVQLWELMKHKKNNMCLICMYKQESKEALIMHIKTNHLLSAPDSVRVKREIFICAYCNGLFFNKILLSAHISSFHLYTKEEKKHKTTYCPIPICKRRVKLDTLWFHFQNHFLFSTGVCPICFMIFDDYEQVLEHVESHPGYFSCNICNYETDKERLFHSHVKTHIKTVKLAEESNEEMKKVLSYFVPGTSLRTGYNKKVVNLFRGVIMVNELQICVLCRTMCSTREEMRQHIHGDHSPEAKAEQNRYLCVCGEEFFNAVLLKHHIFVNKGNHKVYDGKSPLRVKIKSEKLEMVKAKNPVLMDQSVEKKKVFIEVYNNNASNKTDPVTPNEQEVTVNKDINNKYMNHYKNNYKSKVISKSAIQSCNENDKPDNTIEKRKMDDQSENIVEITIKINEAPIENVNLDISIKDKPNEMEVPKKRVNNSTLLNSALSKKFKSTKQFYEQVLNLTDDINDNSDDDDDEKHNENDLVRISDLFEHNTIEAEQIQSQWPPEAEVYEVVEITGDSNEGSENMIIDETGGLFGL